MGESPAASAGSRRILVTGARGMLGTDVCRALSPRHDVRGVDIDDFDVTDPEGVRAALAVHRPEAVIHCAAWTDVVGCERDRERAFEQNERGTRHVAEAAAEVGACVIYLSTDYVFDGEKGEPYTELDAPNPINVYGASKLAGEEAVRTLGSNHYIIRSAWLFGSAGKNFVAAILGAAKERDEVKVVGDQFGSPTYTKDLAGAVGDLVLTGRLPPGTHHLVNSGVCSWAELAAEALVAADSQARVRPIASDEWPSPARRPAYSALRSQWMELHKLPPLRPWREAVRSYVREAV